MLSAPTHRAALLAEIRAITAQQLEAVRARQWEQARSLDRRRLEGLDQLFRQAFPAAEREALAPELRALAADDEALLALVREARSSVAGRMQRQRRQRGGADAYRAAGGGRVHAVTAPRTSRGDTAADAAATETTPPTT